MFENIKEAVKILKSNKDDQKIELYEVKNLIELYILQELKKGEHPDDLDFDFMDMVGEIIDDLSTDEDMNRVDFKNSIYYKEQEGKDGKREL